MADPVTLGLCSQIDLDLEVSRAAKGVNTPDEADQGTMLLTAEEAMAGARNHHHEEGEQIETRNAEEELDADSVFAKLKSLKSDDDAN
jgi:hypothetical protein